MFTSALATSRYVWKERLCLVCGLSPNNGAGIDVLACRLSRDTRPGVSVTQNHFLGVGRCQRCLVETVNDGPRGDWTARAQLVSDAG